MTLRPSLQFAWFLFIATSVGFTASPARATQIAASIEFDTAPSLRPARRHATAAGRFAAVSFHQSDRRI